MSTAIILGAAVWAEGPSPTLVRRTRHGAALYHAGDVTRIIVSGGVGAHGPSEAEVMAGILMDEGVSEDVIALEGHSTTTEENLRNALPMVKGGPVVIVSDWYHLPRAKLVARRLGVDAGGSAPQMRWRMKSILREVAAYLLYWLRVR